MNDNSPYSPLPRDAMPEIPISPRMPRASSAIDATRMSVILGIQDPRDERRWLEFASIYEPIVTAYVRKQRVPWHEVEELVQQIFIKLWEGGAKKYDPAKGRFRSWLYTVVHHTVCDWFDGLSRVRRENDALRERGGLNSTRDTAVLRTPEPQWDDDVRRQLAQVAMEQVRAACNEVTWACFEQTKIAGRPAADVARELGLTRGAVFTNTSRTLDKIREATRRLTEEWDDGPTQMP